MAEAQSVAPSPFVIGIAGGSGSGKTTIADAIVKLIGRERIAFLHHDNYYRDLSHLPIEERAKNNFDHPNSLETELLVEHVKQLKEGKTAKVPVYDFKHHSRVADQFEPEEARPVIIVEGILIFADPVLRDILDIKIFVDTDPDLRFIRRMERDIRDRGRTVESVVAQWYATVRPMHMQFVEPSKRYADVIVPEGGYNTVAIDMIAAHMNSLLAQHHITK
eukprot:TRINITY_DN11107_c0_g1_i1.p1 TRINITY_DN11107_c0_g1~~TRINITY_DN11107_c0_g1_i1.p1  ORF type:complete len:220 (+),score=58.64 TRINITY_DN11107_c0_g1_i1:86-745(+)